MAGDPTGPGEAGSGQEPVEGLPPGVKLGPPPGVKLGRPPGIPAGAVPSQGDPPDMEGATVVMGPPPGVKLGRPPGIPAGAGAQTGKEEISLEDLPPGVVLGEVGPPKAPAMSAIPYIGRSLGMVRGHLPLVI